MRAFADDEILAWIDAARFEPLEFLEHRVGFDDDARRDKVADAGMQNPARDVVEFVDLISADDRVTSVGPP